MDFTINSLFLLACLPWTVHGVGDNCPYEDCYCYENVIGCADEGMRDIPALHRVNYTMLLQLNLNENQITTVLAGNLPPSLLGIDFSSNPITTIDDHAFDPSADTLTEISFAQARFTTLPQALINLKTLQHLMITETPVTDWNLPVIQHLGQTLETLSLISVGITGWPDWIKYLPHLGTLILNNWPLSVPDNAFDQQLSTLFSLNLYNTSLISVPHAVSKLTQLKYLVLDFNHISNLTGLPNSTVLQTLSMDNNNISDPQHVRQALLPLSGSLSYFQMRQNALTTIPDLSSMLKLDAIFFNQNKIAYVGTGKMPLSLTVLALDDNKLLAMEFVIQSCYNLMVVTFTSNNLRQLHGWNIPANLSSLDVSRNLITQLDDVSFPANAQMQTLTLDWNPIVNISANAFVNLQHLASLSLMDTKLTKLPLALGELTNAKYVGLGQNPRLVCTCSEKGLRSWAVATKANVAGQCGVTDIETFLLVYSAECP